MSETQTPVKHGTICWDECNTKDSGAATKFYCELCGWTTTECDMGGQMYTMVHRDGEPFTGLDPHGAIVLKDFLYSLRTDNRTILMTTHDLDCGLEMGDKVAIQVKGRFALFEDKVNISQENFEEFYFKIIDENGSGSQKSKIAMG